MYHEDAKYVELAVTNLGDSLGCRRLDVQGARRGAHVEEGIRERVGSLAREHSTILAWYRLITAHECARRHSYHSWKLFEELSAHGKSC